MKEIDGSSALILGYGREGKSVHRYLKKNHPGMAIGIADQSVQIESQLEPDMLYLGGEYLSHLIEFDVIVRSPGVPSNTPQLQQAIKEGKRVTSETNIFLSECPGKVIGVTGTKGKSTTSSLIVNILSEKYPDVRLVGNIGKPALDYLDDATESSVFVTELSSYQLEDLKYSPQYAVLLGIKHEHLDHHGSFDEYVQAKQKIFEHQDRNDFLIFNRDNELNNSLSSDAVSQKVTFSINDNVDATVFTRDGKIYYRDKSTQSVSDAEIMQVSEIPLLGTGNLQNVLAALTVGALLAVSEREMRKAIMEFKSLDHRLQYIGEKNGIRFYDDSLATIPEAAMHALEAFGRDVETLIAGGFDRGLSFEEFGMYLARYGLKNLILFPTTGARIWNEVVKSNVGILPNKFEVTTMEKAVDIALENTNPGKICLLSPASPSFGVFKDYADRGDQFKNLLGL